VTGVVRLGRDVGSEPGGWLITTSDWRSAGDERRYLKAIRRFPHAAVYVAETDEGEIVGRLSLARDQHRASSHVADLGLMVAAGWRRQGIGWALMEEAVEWARGAGVRKIANRCRSIVGLTYVVFGQDSSSAASSAACAHAAQRSSSHSPSRTSVRYVSGWPIAKIAAAA
jgi:GNAT superfamily N-acetyltransferase